MVVTGSDRVTLTPLAQRLAFPPDPTRIEADLADAFLASAAFAELYAACAKGQPLDRNTIANNAVHRLRVSPSAKDRFATVFIESVAFAGLGEELSDGGVRLFGDARNSDSQASSSVVREGLFPRESPSSEGGLSQASSSLLTMPGRTAATVLTMPWEVEGGRITISIELDRPLPAEAFQLLTAVSRSVEDLLSVLDGAPEVAREED